MPFLAEASRIVAASPELVFDRLADHPSWREWMPKSFFPVGPSEGPLKVGSRPRVRVAPMPTSTRLKVDVAERGKELAWSGGNILLHAHHRFLFEPAEGNQTRVRSVETWAGLLAPLMKGFVKPAAEKIGMEQLEGLARSLEKSPPR